MIRRETADQFLLITQHDHALLAGEIARRLGNACVMPPVPHQEVLEAIAHHDAGWPLHDEHPTLNPDGLPLHVFETPAALGVQVWNASVARAMNLGDYQGLLVSLHTLGLSALWMGHARNPSRPDLFELNKFQHRQIEIQEDLRPKVGLTNDVTRQLGLAAPGTSPAEDRLIFNFRLLTLMDRLSLNLCCGKMLFARIEDVPFRPGESPTPISLTMPDASTLTLDPWPFDQAEMAFEVPARAVAKRVYADVGELHWAYGESTPQRLVLTLRTACR
jgi:hypothetical protein